MRATLVMHVTVARVLARLVLSVVCMLAAGAMAPASADVQVVATIKPLHALVSAVMKGAGQPALLVSGVGSPHSYSLKPSEAAALQRAQVVFWIGPNLELFLRDALRNKPGSAKVVALGHAPGVRHLPLRTGLDWRDAHDHGHSHDHNHNHGHEGAERKLAETGHIDDPHMWLDPQNGKAIVAEVARVLSAVDAGRASLYAANAAAARAEIDRAQSDISKALGAVKYRPYVVFHDAYQYFEARFGLTAVGAISLGDGRSPSVRRLRALRKRLRDKKVVCVFSEPQFEPKLVRTVSEGLRVRTAALDPLGVALAPGPELYGQVLRKLALSLASCLGDKRG